MSSLTHTPHVPVLLDAVVEALQPAGHKTYVDCTVGLGGHAQAILEACGPSSRLIGLDRDTESLAIVQERLHHYGPRWIGIYAPFDHLSHVLRTLEITSVDGILFDLGFSSYQIDSPQRGMSFRHEAKLDMRFDRSASIPTAWDYVNRASPEKLEHIFRVYGEAPAAKRLASAIVQQRRLGPIDTTSQLAQVITKELPHHFGIHPATQIFQALRIAVNDELGQLQRALQQAATALAPRGRLVAISFHSLEDRIVKRFFLREASQCICPPELPNCQCAHHASLRIVTKHPIFASSAEINDNHRARSARMRVAERLGE
ncbi:MAG: 16S rRNA (cytosine(1402)-N(4))-methyltransferase RsmH [Chloroflexi bacterium]|nr:16S rRNA (cytosine(1402)-N(4))-methyltransferase RsmH [Chloroflexota bacterium]